MERTAVRGHGDEPGGPSRGLAARATIHWGIGLGLVLCVLAIGYAVDVLLLAFAGLLVAVLLRGLSELLRKVVPLGERWSLFLTVLGIVVAVGTIGWILAPRIGTQFEELRGSLPQAFDAFRQWLEGFEWGRRLLASIPSASELLPRRQDVFSRMTGAVSGTFAAFGSAVLIVIMGLYFAAQPRAYVNGLLLLAPQPKRKRVRQLLDELAETLRRWLVGKLMSMAIVGILTWGALALMGIELAFTLALLAALLTFIPNFGPIIAAVPAVLLGFLDEPMMALWVALAYLGVQTVESYAITPLIQQRALSIPPALTLTSQIMLAVFAGGLGLALATPLVAMAIVLIRELYARDVLGEDVDALTT